MKDEYEITIAGPRNVHGEPSTTRRVPFLPRVGDYIGIDDAPDCSGYVSGVSFWWPEDGRPLHIEVRVK